MTIGQMTDKEKYLRVDQEAGLGLKVKDLCLQYGVKRDNYYAWRKTEVAAGRKVAKLGNKKKKGVIFPPIEKVAKRKTATPKMLEIPVAPAPSKPAPMALFVGTREQLLEIYREMSR